MTVLVSTMCVAACAASGDQCCLCRPLLAVIWPELVSAELAKLPAEQLGAPAARALAAYKVSAAILTTLYTSRLLHGHNVGLPCALLSTTAAHWHSYVPSTLCAMVSTLICPQLVA